MTEAMPEYCSPYLNSPEKRMFDIAAGSALLAVSAPVELATAALLSQVLDEGPLLFRQERTGNVAVTKWRTMYNRLPEQAMESVWDASSPTDVRIPKKWGVANFARITGADEFPQVRQVVKGALLNSKPRLSLVGLRPLIPDHADEMRDAIAYAGHKELALRWRELHDVAPKGVISPAATYYKGRSFNTEIDPVTWAKLEYGYSVDATRQVDEDMVAYTCAKLVSSLVGRVLPDGPLLGPA